MWHQLPTGRGALGHTVNRCSATRLGSSSDSNRIPPQRPILIPVTSTSPTTIRSATPSSYEGGSGGAGAAAAAQQHAAAAHAAAGTGSSSHKHPVATSAAAAQSAPESGHNLDQDLGEQDALEAMEAEVEAAADPAAAAAAGSGQEAAAAEAER